MIWQNPRAWAGLGALGVPLLVHLLSRNRARPQLFPTLRFLDIAPITPTRRTRLHDLVLLAVRLGVVAAAVAGLAQPLFNASTRGTSTTRTVARAIIVDTSASMRRRSPSGELAVDAARRDALRLAREAGEALVLETSTIPTAIAGAGEWLGARTTSRELIVISDFQSGAVERTDLAGLPRDTHVALNRVDIRADSAPLETRVTFGNAEHVAAFSLQPDRTDVVWSVHVANRAPASALSLHMAQSEQALGDAAREAALATTPVSLATNDHAVAIVYPHFEQRTQWLSDAKPVDKSWMTNVLARIGPDSTMAFAARASSDGRDQLVLFASVSPGSLASAALIAATVRALSEFAPPSELDPAHIADDSLRAWEHRGASIAPSTATSGSDASDGRWLWMLTLVLLGVEWLIRRRMSPSHVPEPATERVA